MARDAARCRGSSLRQAERRPRLVRRRERRPRDRRRASPIRDHARLRVARRLLTRARRAARGGCARATEIRRPQLLHHDPRRTRGRGVSRAGERGRAGGERSRARAVAGGLGRLVAGLRVGPAADGFDRDRALGRAPPPLSRYRAVRYDRRRRASFDRRQRDAGVATGVGRGAGASGGLARSSSDQRGRPTGARACLQRRVDVWPAAARRHARPLEPPARPP